MGDSVICAQVRVDTSKSECLSAQITESPIHSPPSPPISHTHPHLPNKETLTPSHTYFLLRKSYCAIQTLYSSRTNTHFTSIERTAVTVSLVSSRIITCPFYSCSPTRSGRSSTSYTKNSHPSSHNDVAFSEASRQVPWY